MSFDRCLASMLLLLALASSAVAGPVPPALDERQPPAGSDREKPCGPGLVAPEPSRAQADAALLAESDSCADSVSRSTSNPDSPSAASLQAFPGSLRTSAAPGSDQPPEEPESVSGRLKWEDYEQLMQNHGALAAYGPDLFGDNVNLANGGLSFSVTDVSIPGNSALSVDFTRLYTVRNRKDQISDGALADWTLDIPHIRGMAVGRTGGMIAWKNQRCGVPVPSAAGPDPITLSGGVIVPTDDLWFGLEAHMPGGGSMVHVPTSKAPKPPSSTKNGMQWATAGRNYFECIDHVQATTFQPGASGQGFVGVTPDGTRYTFNWLASYREAPLETAFPDLPILRRKALLYATRVEDRFGNWVAYDFDQAQTPQQPGRLVAIRASDGRRIDIFRDSSGLVSQVTDGSHWWSYQYQAQPNNYGTLSRVNLPDGRHWALGFGDFAKAEMLYVRPSPQKPPIRNCRMTAEVGNAGPLIGWVKHPTGAVGTFELAAQTFGRTNVPLLCRDLVVNNGVVDESNASSFYTLVYDNFAIVRKSVDGPLLPASTWRYQFTSPFSYFLHPSGQGLPICGPGADCSQPVCTDASCAGRQTATVFGPDGKAIRHVFGNSYRYDEGLLLKVEEGASAGPGWPLAVERTTTYDYQLALSGQAYASRIGVEAQSRGDGFSSEFVRPERGVRIDQDGASFQWDVEQYCTLLGVDCFDIFARPNRMRQSSSLDSSMSRIAVSEYDDNLSLWVLGQLQREAFDGIEVERSEYDARALPIREWRFGRQVGSYGWHSDGRIAWADDALGRRTALTNWYRGVPRRIDYADGTSRQAGVDPLGRIIALTDQNGFTTSYQWDSLGRPTRIDYPVGDVVAWLPVTFSLIQETQANPSLGLAAGHWRWVRSHGNQQSVTYLDALWRPLIEERFDVANPTNTRTAVITRYDDAGRVAFRSDPQRDLSAGWLGSYPGTRTQYDALDRARRLGRDSELGELVTSVDWLSGFRQRVTNPRGFATTTSFQAFAEPSTEFPVLMVEPESVTTSITRNIFGQATAQSRSDAGSGETLLRRYVYDTDQRLCKEIHPESGATIHWYDAVGNLERQLTGSSLTAAVCDRASAPWWEATQTVYDAMDRTTLVDVPSTGADVRTTYTPDGLIATLSSALPDSEFIWRYQYNHRRLVTQERSEHLSGGLINPAVLRWSYDGLGHVTLLQTPNNRLIDYAPNALGQPTRAGNFATGAAYAPDGQLIAFTYGNGVTRSVSRNARGLPSRVLDLQVGQTVIDEQVSYDPVGNVSVQTDGLGAVGGSRWLGYDGRDRLTSAWIAGVGTESFAYDAFDRLRTRSSPAGMESFHYDARFLLSRVDGAGATRWHQHDARGNVTFRAGFSHVFDALNRLTQTPGVGRFEYDGHGRRTLTWRAGLSPKIDYYDRAGLLRYTTDAVLGGGINYIYLGRTLVAQDAAPWGRSWGITFMHTDAQGTPIAKTDGTGAVVERTRRWSYGDSLGAPVVEGLGFTAHMEDPAQALVYMQQRYYDPSIGRFLSVDPVTADGGDMRHFNRYAYAYNNPYKFTDPDGRCPSCIGAAVGVGLELLVQGAEIAAGSRDSFDGGRVVISGVAGATGVGAAQLISRGARLGTLAKVALSRASDAGVSAGSQLAKDGEVSLTATAIDVAAGATVGRLAGDAAASRAANSATGKVLARQADRTARIAAQNPRAAKQTAAESARAAQVGHTTGAAAASGTSAANAGSSAVNTGCVIAKGKSC